ncbi:MAG: glycosyltransferase family 39 protein [Deltaproteobacteria bacterium]|nr:glycosyltransferase family 39 protein [Deltaproteobacteria bacterium]
MFLYYWYGSLFKCFGTYNMLAIHAATTLWILATAWVLSKITQEFGSRKAGHWAALFYVVFTTTYAPKILATTFEYLFNLPLALNIYFLILFNKTRRWYWVFLSGFVFGVALITKYQAGINLVVTFLYLIWKRKEKTLPIFCIGMGLPVGCMLLHLASLGVLDDFYFWTLKGSFAYIQSGIESLNFFTRLLLRGGGYVLSTLLIWILGLAYFRRHPKNILLLWFGLSFIPVCAGGRFYGHYFLQLLPPLCIAAGLALAQHHKKILAWVWLGILVPGIGFSFPRYHLNSLYTYLKEDNPDDYKILAQYLLDHTTPKDPVFVWGYAPSIYFFVKRPLGARFYWSDILVGRVPGTSDADAPHTTTTGLPNPWAWKLLFLDLDKKKPIYFVDTTPGNYHGYRTYPPSNYFPLKQYLAENYYLETIFQGSRFYRRKNH